MAFIITQAVWFVTHHVSKRIFPLHAYAQFTFACNDDVYHRAGNFKLSSFRFLIVLSALAAALSLAACTNSETQWSNKITIEVETPNGLVSGSIVTRETASFTTGALVPPDARGGGVSRAGEAVVVDLGGGKYLFALLPNPDSTQIFFPGQGPQDVAPKMAGLIGQSRTLSPKDCPKVSFPMLVTLSDINNPKTVKEVPSTNIAAVFGSGYRLKAVTLEITDEAVTMGVIEKALVWLPGLNGGYLSGDSSNDGRFYSLHAGHFSNGR